MGDFRLFMIMTKQSQEVLKSISSKKILNEAILAEPISDGFHESILINSLLILEKDTTLKKLIKVQMERLNHAHQKFFKRHENLLFLKVSELKWST